MAEKKKYGESESIRSKFSDEYCVPVIARMDECAFKDTYLPKLVNVISECMNQTVGLDEAYPENQEYSNIEYAYCSLISNCHKDKSHKSVSDIKDSVLSPRIAAIIKTIYGDIDSYIYTLSEPVVDKYLSYINMEIPHDADLLEKQDILFFWKKCNIQMETWSMQMFVEFLTMIAE